MFVNLCSAFFFYRDRCSVLRLLSQLSTAFFFIHMRLHMPRMFKCVLYLRSTLLYAQIKYLSVQKNLTFILIIVYSKNCARTKKKK